MSRMRWIFLAGVIVSALTLRAETDPGKYMLTSVKNNIHADEWSATGNGKTPSGRVTWSVKMTALHGGQSHAFVLEIGMHAGKKSVAAKAAQVINLGAGRETQLDTAPPTSPSAK